jgi:hypothetical protein
MPEGEIQIPPATVAAATIGDLGKADQPYHTPFVSIPYAAPYLGRVRMLMRITLKGVIIFVPSGNVSAPETIECSFDLYRGGIPIFSTPVGADQALLQSSGIAYYSFQIDTDFNNPYQMTLPENLRWRFSGALQRQVAPPPEEEEPPPPPISGSPTLRFALSHELQPV